VKNLETKTMDMAGLDRKEFEMGTLKGATDRIAGKTKEAAAEIIGDGKLREEGKAQQRNAKTGADQPGEAYPLRSLDKLT
jgi:uncharacterized protein YjbJ (UPF0337 family)